MVLCQPRLPEFSAEPPMHDIDPSQLLSPAQLSGYAALILGVTAFLQRRDRRLRLFLVAECAAYVVHFALLGNPPAASSAAVSGVRTLLSLRLRSRALALVVMAIYVVLGAVLTQRCAGWLPVVGSCLATWGLLTKQGIAMRLLVLASTCLWLVNNIVSGSIGGTLLEALIATASTITIVRMARESGAARSETPPPA
jgi:hypothetical protein